MGTAVKSEEKEEEDALHADPGPSNHKEKSVYVPWEKKREERGGVQNSVFLSSFFPLLSCFKLSP